VSLANWPIDEGIYNDLLQFFEKHEWIKTRLKQHQSIGYEMQEPDVADELNEMLFFDV
jgi:hypothetical protein